MYYRTVVRHIDVGRTACYVGVIYPGFLTPEPPFATFSANDTILLHDLADAYDRAAQIAGGEGPSPDFSPRIGESFACVLRGRIMMPTLPHTFWQGDGPTAAGIAQALRDIRTELLGRIPYEQPACLRQPNMEVERV